ncbi:MAG: hypothetical protein ACXVCY_13125 [Pseudobdellovibrionaceae bacterium]
MRIKTVLVNLQMCLLILFGSHSIANAAIRRCFVDPVACPTGNHIHCTWSGWCGPACTDSCSDVNPNPVHRFEEQFDLQTGDGYQQPKCGEGASECINACVKRSMARSKNPSERYCRSAEAFCDVHCGGW